VSENLLELAERPRGDTDQWLRVDLVRERFAKFADQCCPQ
jgi:hypothetical protein